MEEHPINIRLIDHVVVRANNLEQMIDFYREVLGCRLERGPGEIGLAQLRAGDSLIDLVDVSGPLGRQGGASPDPDAPNMDHFLRAAGTLGCRRNPYAFEEARC